MSPPTVIITSERAPAGACPAAACTAPPSSSVAAIEREAKRG
jgi:hypothetical protein